ncbi:Sulfhydryl oxidase, partial [Caligus rogercresseyi]
NLNLPDVVYEGDLEKVVKYMLSVEIPMYSLEDNSRTLLRYLPLRKEIITTILELRNWLDETPDISEEDYKSKVIPFVIHHRIGRVVRINSYFRGYPCGVWTLFHVLSVEAMNTEESELSQEGPTRVTLSIMEYIKYFFSCRNCAENFMKKVDSIGYLPSAPETT